MRLHQALVPLFFLWPAAAEAVAAAPRAALEAVLQTGLNSDRLAEARQDLAAHPDAEAQAELAEVEEFASRFKAAKAAPSLSKEDAQALRSELESLMSRVGMAPDASLVDAYMGQLPPTPETKKALDQRLDDIGRSAGGDQGAAYQAKAAEIKQLASQGDWKQAYAEFHRIFDQAELKGDARVDAVAIDRALRPRSIDSENQFQEYRDRLAKGLDEIDVPAPKAKSDGETKGSGATAVPSAVVTTLGVGTGLSVLFLFLGAAEEAKERGAAGGGRGR